MGKFCSTAMYTMVVPHKTHKTPLTRDGLQFKRTVTHGALEISHAIANTIRVEGVLCPER